MYNNSKENLQVLLCDFEKWIARMMKLDEQELPQNVKDNLLRYARNVAVGLSRNYCLVREGVDIFMGGVVSRYSPVEQEIHDAVEAAVEAEKIKNLTNMCKYYDAGKFTLQEAAKETNLSEQDFLAKYQEYLSKQNK